MEVPPSPNDHTHDVGVFVEASVNWMVTGTVPVVAEDTNAATGAATLALTVTYPVLETVALPSALVTVRVTV